MGQAPVIATFKAGDKVWVPLAVGRVCGTIIEDRGRLGVSGQHLFRVSVPRDPYAPEDFLLQESELSHLDQEELEQLETPLPLDAIMDFLINGGLVSMLQRNSRKPVWLRRDSRGNLTFTFIEGYSATGGQPAPRGALHGERVFAPMQPQVVEFIKSFGLDLSQANHVVSAVGTSP